MERGIQEGGVSDFRVHKIHQNNEDQKTIQPKPKSRGKRRRFGSGGGRERGEEGGHGGRTAAVLT